MRIPSRKRIKKRLSRELIYYPLLRMLLFKRWFRRVFLALVAVGIFLALFIPKIWTVSPEGFHPVIKVSGLDLAQAWSLKGTARQAEEQNDWGAAAYAWQAAVANNQANPDLVRGLIRTVTKADDIDPRYPRAAVGYSFWLLRLTQTNSADLQLVLDFDERYRHYELVAYLLRSEGIELTPTDRAAYLRALFYLNRMSDFQNLLQEIESRGELTEELALYKAAFQAGWRQGEEAEAGRSKLREAQNAEHEDLVTRLQLAVQERTGEAVAYASAFGRLQDSQLDTVSEHIAYWGMLKGLGQLDKAAELAQEYSRPPKSPLETTRLAEAFIDLGLERYAASFLDRFAPQFGDSQDLWLTYANLLIQLEEWEALRSIAVDMRNRKSVREGLTAYSHFIEGRAEHALERRQMADIAFRKAARFGFANARLGVAVGTSLLAAHRFLPAAEILISLEETFREPGVNMKEKQKFYSLLAQAMDSAYDPVPEKQQALYLRALFQAGRVADFAQQWEALSAGDLADPELALFRAAYDIGWGAAGEALAGKEVLAQAVQKPEQALLANRLIMMLSDRLGELPAYAAAMQRAVAMKDATLLDHISHWRLLALNGNADEARELASAGQLQPSSAFEVIKLAEALDQLNLSGKAADAVQRGLLQFESAQELWVFHGNRLIRQERWHELGLAARKVRQLTKAGDPLSGFSHYLEGLIALKRDNDRDAALGHFEAASSEGFENLAMALSVAENMRRFGWPDLSHQILQSQKSRAQTNVPYWEAVFGIAAELKNEASLLESAEALYRLDPEEEASLNRYAAALLLTRARPEEAVQITFRLLNGRPNSVAAIVNHSLALLQNHRTTEAKETIERVAPERLRPEESLSYHLAWFEIHMNQSSLASAKEALDKIDLERLFPSQRAWVEKRARQILATAQSKA